MATEPKSEVERFEDVDWDELGGVAVGRRTLGFLLALVGFFTVLAYDLFVVPDNQPTFPAFGWDVSAVDWLFGLTLLVLFVYGVVPLATNRRLTAHYWRQFRKNRAAVASLAFLLVIFVVGTVGTMFITPPQLNTLEAYQPPVFSSVSSSVPITCVGETVGGQCQGSWEHPLGTTGQGKDILKMVIFGMRVSMQVGLIATFIIIVLATTVGTTAAYLGGWVDELLMRYVDIQLTFPTFFLYLLLVYLFGGSLFLLIVIFGITGWGAIARLVRSEALQRSEEEFVQAARGAGASTPYVLWRHLVPNVSNTVITAATLTIPGLILAEAALSFLGLGDPTIPSWGRVIADGRGDLSTAWWISTIPGFFLFFTILAFNFLGDALRDSLDPRQEGGS
ncbi:ABC transporter permease [Halorussus halophilus]|uniref:ABC transporter permease n=1 Tax=Halorussus halophilus TaxID=2650975 RepID=UPI0013015CB9|nr:ABC transporter permease [Halorussus halophilus]